MSTEHIMWSPGVSLEAIERQVIFKAFKFYKSNKTATAQALGISIRTLDNKFEKYAEDDTTERTANDQRRLDRDAFLKRSRGEAPSQYDTAASPSTSARLRMEPPTNAPAQQPVPVSKPEEVQGVLPRQASGGGNRGRR